MIMQVGDGHHLNLAHLHGDEDKLPAHHLF